MPHGDDWMQAKIPMPTLAAIDVGAESGRHLAEAAYKAGAVSDLPKRGESETVSISFDVYRAADGSDARRVSILRRIERLLVQDEGVTRVDWTYGDSRQFEHQVTQRLDAMQELIVNLFTQSRRRWWQRR